MAKNTTRKGLALGAAFALVGSALVAAPAQAAGEVSLAVNGGTGTTTVLGEAFSLKATIGALVPDSSNNTLKFLVENSTSASLTYTADAGTKGVYATTQGIESTQVDGAGTSATAASSGSSDAVNGNFTAGTGALTTAAVFEDNQTLSIKSAATTAHSVVVTAWLDSDGSGTINNSEFASSPVTISFVKAADAGFSVAMKTAPQLGDGTYVAKITSSVINIAQVNVANFGVQAGIYVAGTKTAIDASGYTYGTLSAATLATNGVAVTLNSDKNALETAATSVSYTSGGAQTTLIAGNYVAQAIYSADAGTTAWAALGSEIGFTLAAATANAANSSEAITAVTGKVTTSGAVLKDYTGDIVYSVTVQDANKANLAGRVVRLTVTTETGTWKVNGSDVATGGNYDATTNASGVASFVFKSVNGAATDALVIGDIKSEGVTIEASGDTTNLAYAASTWTAVDVSTGATSQATDVVRSAAPAGSTTLNFQVRDQFGNSFADANYRMVATVSGRTVATLTDSLSDGAASFSVADGALTTGDATVALSYQKLASGVWGANTDITAVSNRTVKFYTQTNTVDITQTTVTKRHAQKEAKAGDTRLGFTATVFDSAGTNSDETAVISGTVKNASTLAAAAGTLITISGPSNVLFNVNDVYGFGTLTFSDADGSFSVNAYSNVVQSNSVVTVTSSLGGSDTVKVSFNGVATNAGTALVIGGDATVLPGSTLIVTGSLKDVYGNGVDTDITATDWDDSGTATAAGEVDAEFELSVTGPGLTLATLPTATGSDGTFTFARLLGQNDKGTIVVTATYGGANGVIGTGDDDVTVSKSFTIGAAPAAAKVNVGSFNGKLVVYANGYNGKKISWKVGGKWGTAVAASDTARFARVTPVKGVTVSVDIYVDGVKMLTKSVVTK